MPNPRGDTVNKPLQGPPGRPGADASIAVGEVTTTEAGTQATVTNVGTGNSAILNFSIPAGADGASAQSAANPTEFQDLDIDMPEDLRFQYELMGTF